MARRRSRKKGLPAQLDQVNLHAAGIDVGSESHWVAIPPDHEGQCVRMFSAFTSGLEELADWLQQSGVTTVVMESTGVYWIPLYELLESRKFEVLLADPRRLKNVPGRKTDVLDCQWLQQLHTFGLLTGAFRPAEQICRLRAYVRQRGMLVESAARHVLHMQKALQQMNVRLDKVLNDITGKSGMTIIEAILDGERDPLTLAKLRDGRCQNSEETIAEALRGTWREEHLFALRQAVLLYRTYYAQVAECDQRIEALLAAFPDRSDGQPVPPSAKRARLATPKFDTRNALKRVTAVDLARIDGIDGHTALNLISEIGVDMSRWTTEKHFTSWLGLCPGNRLSGGVRLSSRTKPSANRAAAALRLAANGLHRSKSALGAYLRRMKMRLGKPAAITATAHKLARLVYSALKHGWKYNDPGQDWYQTQYDHRVLKSLTHRAAQHGFKLVPADPQISS